LTSDLKKEVKESSFTREPSTGKEFFCCLESALLTNRFCTFV